MQIEKCQFYNKLYKDLGSTSKEDKKRVRKAMKECPRTVLEAAFKELHPNKKINLLEAKDS